jgi:hypothetical protein
LRSYREYFFGFIEARRFTWLGRNPVDGNIAEKHYELAWKIYPGFARAYASDAGVRDVLLRRQLHLASRPTPANDSQQFLEGLKAIEDLYHRCIEHSGRPWMLAYAHNGLATASCDRACAFWQTGSRGEAEKAFKIATLEADFAQKYSDTPSYSYVTAAELKCVRLLFETDGKPNEVEKRASQEWESISRLMDQADYFYWPKPVDLNELLERCPAFEVLNELGGRWPGELSKLTQKGS